MGDIAISISSPQLADDEAAVAAPLTQRSAPRPPQPTCTTLLVDLRGTVAFADGLLPAEGGTPLSVSNRRPERREDQSPLDFASFLARGVETMPVIQSMVVLLTPQASPLVEQVVDHCVALARFRPECRVCLVSSFRVHFDDARWLLAEVAVAQQFRRATGRGCVVVRPGNIVDDGRRPTATRVLAALYPLISRKFRSCFVELSELHSAIDQVLRDDQPRAGRIYTLLGANRPVREVAAQLAARGIAARFLTGLAYLLRLLLLGVLLRLAFRALARWHKPLRRWQFDTLEPATISELLELYNPLNARHVALAGYNNGVTHFGWRFPGRTVVKTTACGRRVRVSNNRLAVDAGVTLKRVVRKLSRAGRQLYVVPNFSYISMGTIFVVPVHGSGSEVSTLGETIERVLLYDPQADRLLSLRRDQPRFAHYMYNSDSGALVLRLRFRICSKLRYELLRSVLHSPTAEQLWSTFADPEASNIEVRKAGSNATSVDVCKYYAAPARNEDGQLDEAKDSLGRLWDRLEENRLSAFLFHALTRRFLYHVELFLDEHEFGVFWAAHERLRLVKIQLRHVRADGLPHSPVGERDCISADLIMRRSASADFMAFIKEHLPHARFNRGKHSL